MTQNEIQLEKNTYNGYKNYETWNVVLWLGNEYVLYCAAQGYKKYPHPYRSLRSDLSKAFGFSSTKDGVSLWDTSLDIEAIDEVIATM